MSRRATAPRNGKAALPQAAARPGPLLSERHFVSAPSISVLKGSSKASAGMLIPVSGNPSLKLHESKD